MPQALLEEVGMQILTEKIAYVTIGDRSKKKALSRCSTELRWILETA